MTKQLKCLRCGCSKLYSVRREKKRCSDCRYEWIPWKLPLHDRGRAVQAGKEDGITKIDLPFLQHQAPHSWGFLFVG